MQNLAPRPPTDRLQRIERARSLVMHAAQDGGNLVLKGADVLRNNWFFLFVDAIDRKSVV
mgnify:CR=1 FL=1